MPASPLSATTDGPRYALRDAHARYVRTDTTYHGPADLATATTWTREEADTLAANNPDLTPVPVPEPGTPQWYERIADDMRDRQHATIVDALLAAHPTAEDMTTVREYALPKPTLIGHPYRPGERLVAYRLRVSVTRFHDGTEPYVRAEAYTATATRSGRPHARATRSWTTMPDTLADHLPTD